MDRDGPMPAEIVVGVDDTSASLAALHWACRRAESLGSGIALTHVVDDEWTVSAARAAEAELLLVRLADEAARDFPGTLVRISQRIGNVSIELLRESEGASLLVVGTHKTGFVQGRVFGSRSMRLAAGASSPVAVIPEWVSGARSGVVVGLDDSIAGREAIRFASAEADRLGEDLVLLLATGGRHHHDDEHDARYLDLTTRALRQTGQVSTDLGVRIRTIARPPGVALVDAAADATLLVVGSSRRHIDGVTALGPVTHDVLFNIGTPTIVVHPNDPR